MRGSVAKRLRRDSGYSMKEERQKGRVYSKPRKSGSSLECHEASPRSLYREIKNEYKQGVYEE